MTVEPSHSETDERYFVDGAKATREEFEAATGWGPQNRKTEAGWFTYEDGRLAATLFWLKRSRRSSWVSKASA